MWIAFVRHAVSEGSQGTEQGGNKLSAAGTHQAKHVALALKASHVDVELVLSSPLLQSAQTAAIIGHEFNNLPVETSDSLLPPGDAQRLRQRLAQAMNEGVEGVAIVGHSPSLEQMLSEVIADTRAVGLHLERGGAGLVELPVEDAPNGAVLHWLMGTDQLEAVAAQAPAHRA